MTDSAAAERKAGQRGSASSTRKGAATRTRILDAAEALFADRGYAGAAMRDIAELAAVEQGLISYYFKSKGDLFYEALSRCSAVTLGVQLEALEQLLRDYGEQTPGVEAILHTYTESALDPLSRGDRQFVNVVKLAWQYAHAEHAHGQASPIVRHYQPVQARYLAALQRALPDNSRAEVRWGFSVFEAAYMHLILDHSREAAKGGEISVPQVTELRQRLARFCAAGFVGLRQNSPLP